MYNLIQQNQHITLLDLPKGTNMTNFSILNALSEKLSFRAFSIKCVVEGLEKYDVHGTSYYVKSGEYLLANTFGEGKVAVESKEFVRGLCIDIAPAVLSEVFAHFVKPDTAFPDILLDDFFTTEAFLENKYHTKQTHLGKKLIQIADILCANPFESYQMKEDFYFTLAESIVADHQQTITQLYNINAVKHQTRKDLYRKVLLGREFLVNNTQKSLQIKEVAQEVGLSEYHFFRLFKTAFGISPQQYFLQTRLEKSWHLLQTANYSVTEVATETGFADIHSFSKAFKKRFATSPTQVISVL